MNRTVTELRNYMILGPRKKGKSRACMVLASVIFGAPPSKPAVEKKKKKKKKEVSSRILRVNPLNTAEQ